jgi:lipoprotein signal peptidase
MKEKLNKASLIKILFLAVAILLDHLTKYLAFHKKVGLLNKGVSWGLAANLKPVYHIVAAAIINLVLVWLIFTLEGSTENSSKDRELNIASWGLTLILAGGTGNMLSRIVQGGVWDWISLGNFPLFNLADMLINIGVAIFISAYLLYGIKGKSEKDKK